MSNANETMQSPLPRDAVTSAAAVPEAAREAADAARYQKMRDPLPQLALTEIEHDIRSNLRHTWRVLRPWQGRLAVLTGLTLVAIACAGWILAWKWFRVAFTGHLFTGAQVEFVGIVAIGFVVLVWTIQGVGFRMVFRSPRWLLSFRGRSMRRVHTESLPTVLFLCLAYRAWVYADRVRDRSGRKATRTRRWVASYLGCPLLVSVLAPPPRAGGPSTDIPVGDRQLLYWGSLANKGNHLGQAWLCMGKVARCAASDPGIASAAADLASRWLTVVYNIRAYERTGNPAFAEAAGFHAAVLVEDGVPILSRASPLVARRPLEALVGAIALLLIWGAASAYTLSVGFEKAGAALVSATTGSAALAVSLWALHVNRRKPQSSTSTAQVASPPSTQTQPTATSSTSQSLS